MNPFQCQLARAALAWSTADLARAAVLGISTVTRFEAGLDARMSSVDKMRRTLEAAGAVFFDESGGSPGMRLRKPEGADCYPGASKLATQAIKPMDADIEVDRWKLRT